MTRIALSAAVLFLAGCNVLTPDELHLTYGEADHSLLVPGIDRRRKPITTAANGDSEFWSVGLTWKIPQPESRYGH